MGAALTVGQVDTLILTASQDAVHDDGNPDAPVADGADGNSSNGTPIAEQVVRLARTTDADVSFIEDPALLAAVGGVGAMLRYRL